MTGRAALVAVVALGLLMGCSAPSTHPSASSSPTTSATQSTTASVSASSATSGVKQSDKVASSSTATGVQVHGVHDMDPQHQRAGAAQAGHDIRVAAAAGLRGPRNR